MFMKPGRNGIFTRKFPCDPLHTIVSAQHQADVDLTAPVSTTGQFTDSNAICLVCVNTANPGQAVRDFGGQGGFAVDVIAADHQNKPDVGANIARQWCDEGGVDMIMISSAYSRRFQRPQR